MYLSRQTKISTWLGTGREEEVTYAQHTSPEKEKKKSKRRSARRYQQKDREQPGMLRWILKNRRREHH